MASQYCRVLGRSPVLEAAFWAACLLLAASFVVLAVAVSNQYELAVDERVTFAVQGLYTRAWADPLFETANRFGDVVPLVLAASALVLALLARRRVSEAAVVVVAMVTPVVVAFSDASVGRPGDIYAAMRATFDGLQYPRIYPGPDGFPSGHVFGEVVVYGLMFWLVSRVTGSWPITAVVRIASAAIIALGFIAPMYLGNHWFTDCVGGAILGTLVLLISWRALRALQREHELVRIDDLVAHRRHAASAKSPELSRTRS